MKCSRVQEMLEEYARGELQGKESSIIGLHLETCSNCREHYAFLLKYLEETGRMPSFRAPDNFVESLNSRIHETSNGFSLRKIYDFLFVPLKIKLPVEAAGLLVIGTIITAIVYPVPDRQPIHREDSETTYQVAENTEKKDLLRSSPAVKVQKKTERLQAVTIQLALLVHPEDEEMINLYSKEGTNARMSAPAKRKAAAADIREEPLSDEKEDAVREAPGTRASSLGSVITSIELIVDRLGGDILFKRIHEDSGSADLHVSIPSHRTNEFLQELANQGTLKDTPPMPIHEKPSRITFNIEIKNR